MSALDIALWPLKGPGVKCVGSRWNPPEWGKKHEYKCIVVNQRQFANTTQCPFFNHHWGNGCNILSDVPIMGSSRNSGGVFPFLTFTQWCQNTDNVAMEIMTTFPFCPFPLATPRPEHSGGNPRQHRGRPHCPAAVQEVPRAEPWRRDRWSEEGLEGTLRKRPAAGLESPRIWHSRWSR